MPLLSLLSTSLALHTPLPAAPRAARGLGPGESCLEPAHGGAGGSGYDNVFHG